VELNKTTSKNLGNGCLLYELGLPHGLFASRVEGSTVLLGGVGLVVVGVAIGNRFVVHGFRNGKHRSHQFAHKGAGLLLPRFLTSLAEGSQYAVVAMVTSSVER